jgi:hypothetical protein
VVVGDELLEAVRPAPIGDRAAAGPVPVGTIPMIKLIGNDADGAFSRNITEWSSMTSTARKALYAPLRADVNAGSRNRRKVKATSSAVISRPS